MDGNSFKIDDALKTLNSDDFHRQLRNELIMIPIPKIISKEFNEIAPLSQGHYLDLACERVKIIKFHYTNTLSEFILERT